MGNESRERGWVTPEAWKTLISIFDVDPRTLRDVPAQVAAIKSTYTRMKDDLHACDARTGACDQTGRTRSGEPTVPQFGGRRDGGGRRDHRSRRADPRGARARRGRAPRTNSRSAPTRWASRYPPSDSASCSARGASTGWRVILRARSRRTYATTRAHRRAPTSRRGGLSRATSRCRRRRGASDGGTGGAGNPSRSRRTAVGAPDRHRHRHPCAPTGIRRAYGPRLAAPKGRSTPHGNPRRHGGGSSPPAHSPCGESAGGPT